MNASFLVPPATVPKLVGHCALMKTTSSDSSISSPQPQPALSEDHAANHPLAPLSSDPVEPPASSSPTDDHSTSSARRDDHPPLKLDAAIFPTDEPYSDQRDLEPPTPSSSSA